MRCWNAVLMAEKKQNVNHYFFQWLRSSTPEEEIYQNLIDLETGKTTLKELNSKLTVSRIDTFFLSSTVADRGGAREPSPSVLGYKRRNGRRRKSLQDKLNNPPHPPLPRSR